MVTTRGQRTRDALLHATAELVAQRGFHHVGIADIGAAAGVSGAAIYRHFESKDALLVAVFETAVGELLDRARAIVHEGGSELAERLIDAHLDFAFANRAVIKVYDQESHNLPPDDRRRVRRQQRSYADVWIDALAPSATAADRDHTRVRVQATFGLINSVADYEARVAALDQRAVLHHMALAALR